MRHKLRVTLLAFIALLVLGLVVSVYVHYKTRNSFKITFNEDKKLEVRIDNVHYSGTKEGRVEWELKADSAKKTKGVDLTLLTNVTAVLYSRNGKSYTLTAREGRYVEGAGEVSVEGNVRIESTDGFVMNTEKLLYKLDSKEISTDADVEMTSGAMDVRGTGFVAEVTAGRLKILKNVRAVIKGAVS